MLAQSAGGRLRKVREGCNGKMQKKTVVEPVQVFDVKERRGRLKTSYYAQNDLGLAATFSGRTCQFNSL
jgi:hypothetical protein